jgi:hypothetical protein
VTKLNGSLAGNTQYVLHAFSFSDLPQTSHYGLGDTLTCEVAVVISLGSCVANESLDPLHGLHIFGGDWVYQGNPPASHGLLPSNLV